jgi:hypothetical protein
MTNNSTKSLALQSEAETAIHVLDDWFDPIEAGLRDRVREFIQAMIEGELLAANAAKAEARAGVLPSWNNGPAKQAIIEFAHATTTRGSPNFVPPPERVTEFDQDGTLWVEHPVYTSSIASNTLPSS